MRIFSKFKDYYDNILPYSSEDRVWERHESSKLLNFPHNIVTEYTGLSQDTEQYLVKSFNALPRIRGSRIYNRNRTRYVNETDTNVIMLGLCGKFYPCFLLNYTDNKTFTTKYNAFLSVEQFIDAFHEKNKDIKITDKYLNQPFMDTWYTEYHMKPDYINVFIELGTPVFMVCWNGIEFNRTKARGNLIINPTLSKLGLQRLFDPYTLYQEIDMYLNNELVTVESPDINLSDELIRDSKGMDEWSFRQMGPKKRKQ